MVFCVSKDLFVIKDAALAGKHIFSEKPLALDLPSIDEALAAVDKAGVRLQVGFVHLVVSWW
jgi:myo-inositol 2-dehydrogenase/D-chiro-inositol 1-dehydrogenase